VNRVTAWAALALAASGCAFAAETAQARGKRIVDEAIAAMGGDAFMHVQNRVESGRAFSFYREQLEGLSVARIYTRYLEPSGAPKPGTLLEEERQAFGKDEQSGFVLFTTDAGWEVTFRGARPLEDQRLEDHKEAALRNIFYIMRERLKEPGISYYAQPSDFYQNRPVDIVDITDDRNVTVTVYFDHFTKLPVRQSTKRRNETYHDFDTEVAEFGKYHTNSGVQWPSDIRRSKNGNKTFELYSDTVEFNKDLKDDIFQLSPKIKILSKAK